MDKNILFLGQPLLSTYNDYAFISAILADKKVVLPWFFNNFINISYTKIWDSYFFENGELIFELCPWIQLNQVSYDMIRGTLTGNLKSFIVKAIDNGYYLRLYVDKYYIPNEKNFEQNHLKHRICIYGYDLNNDLLYYADNIDNGRFGSAKCTFQSLERGFHSNAIANTEDREWYYNIVMYKFKNYKDVSLNLPSIRVQIDNFITSRYSYDLLYNNELIMGKCAIKHLIDDICSADSKQIDLRAIHLLYERKKLMVLRIEYMVENGHSISRGILNEYIQLRDNARRIMYLSVKFCITLNEEYKTRVTDGLIKDLIKEEELCYKLISII